MEREFQRIIRGPIPALGDFLSARDLGVSPAPPEGLEREWAESISVYNDLDYTVRRAQTTRREIGRFVIQLVVPTDDSVEFAQTTRNRRQHSIYGRPVEMNTFYELIHLPSGNVGGDFDAQDDALRALRRITNAEPKSSITDFALMRGDGDEQEPVAMRDQLRELANTPAGTVAAGR